MKKIAVVTATRAEYGLLSPVIKELRKYENEDLKTELIVTGTHLSEKYGMTVKEINDRIDHKIHISVESDSEVDISLNQADTLVKFTELFSKKHYNAVILLGDRYETLAVAIAAGNTRTPVFHLCGGDTTEGALDEWIRHSITKISYLHFVTNEDSRKRVIQLGESPDRVFNYGSTSIDNILRVADMTKSEALDSIGLSDCRYALCTYHPVTMEAENVDSQIAAFLNGERAVVPHVIKRVDVKLLTLPEIYLELITALLALHAEELTVLCSKSDADHSVPLNGINSILRRREIIHGRGRGAPFSGLAHHQFRQTVDVVFECHMMDCRISGDHLIRTVEQHTLVVKLLPGEELASVTEVC